jgi:flagellar motor protein MotB
MASVTIAKTRSISRALRPLLLIGPVVCCALLGGLGCNQNPYLASQPPAWPQAAASQPAQLPAQAQAFDLTRRAGEMDANNRDLHAQLAQSRQQVDLLRDQVQLLQKQLGESGKRMQDLQVAKDQAEKDLRNLQASTTRRGSAIITANNSLRQELRPIEIEGLITREDGEVLRIELPADQLFAPGTAQLVGSAFPVLDRVAAELAQNYPRQVIGIEGHTDSTPLYGGISSHQLANSQAFAVFDQLTRRNRLPLRQFYVTAQGSNQPLATNSTQAGQAKNRRIELVIHPQSFEG